MCIYKVFFKSIFVWDVCKVKRNKYIIFGAWWCKSLCSATENLRSQITHASTPTYV